MNQQLFFDLDFTPPPKSSVKPGGRNRRVLLQRAVLRWFEGQHPAPTGSAVNVATTVTRLRADVAAFWSRPGRNPAEEGPRRIQMPVRTVIVQCHADRDECWPDCIRSRKIMPRLKSLKAELTAVEEEIRREEPELRDNNTLFEEFAEWHYERTRNPRYHQLRHAVRKLEHGLYNGSKFERIHEARLADHFYLAVPAGMIEQDELADGWGLLWVSEDLDVALVHEPEDRQCLPANRMHLVQNIAAAAKPYALRCQGIRKTGGGVGFTRPLTRFRPPEKPHL